MLQDGANGIQEARVLPKSIFSAPSVLDSGEMDIFYTFDVVVIHTFVNEHTRKKRACEFILRLSPKHTKMLKVINDIT